MWLQPRGRAQPVVLGTPSRLLVPGILDCKKHSSDSLNPTQVHVPEPQVGRGGTCLGQLDRGLTHQDTLGPLSARDSGLPPGVDMALAAPPTPRNWGRSKDSPISSLVVGGLLYVHPCAWGDGGRGGCAGLTWTAATSESKPSVGLSQDRGTVCPHLCLVPRSTDQKS